ncbi:unnamed protein product [Heligmosomoides polygyrus]|uniref:BZIP domain-containing protein n=1 Tax=Heligmosomoides polygyrus TaxID=6339 RepID=A0A183GCY0_HELPZ|nr:unnamed protein product [Heligmosomoides polygyrus]
MSDFLTVVVAGDSATLQHVKAFPVPSRPRPRQAGILRGFAVKPASNNDHPLGYDDSDREKRRRRKETVERRSITKRSEDLQKDIGVRAEHYLAKSLRLE